MRRRRDPQSSLEEPLLGESAEDDDDVQKQPRTPVLSPTSSIERDRANEHWQNTLANFLVVWAGWLRHVFLGGQSFVTAVVGAISTLPLIQKQKVASAQERLPPIELSPLLEERLKKIQTRIGVHYNQDLTEHQETLNSLWKAVYPNRKMAGETEVSGWKEMGWQGNHPASDFRGGGFLSLENLVYFAQTYPRAFRSLMLKQEGKRAEWEYPFAAAGVNITVLLTDLLDLRAGQPSTLAGRTFLRILEEDEHAFEELYCVLFCMLDKQWLEMKASYMEFNVVLNSVRKESEQLLSQQTLKSVKELPSYSSLIE